MGRWFVKGFAIAGIWGGVAATAFALGENVIVLGIFVGIIATIVIVLTGKK